MVGARLDAEVEIGADHRAQELDCAFLHGVSGRTESSGKGAVEAMLCSGSVTTLMEEHGVVGDRVAEAGELRHLHMVGRRAIVGLWSAVADVDAEGGAEPFGLFDALGLGQRRHRWRRVAVDLGAIEDGVAASEHAPGGLVSILVAVLGVRLVVAVGGLPEHHEVAVFALANLSAERLAAQLALQPTGRAGQPQDVANAVSFLASPQMDFITGQVIFVDGGKSLGGSGA